MHSQDGLRELRAQQQNLSCEIELAEDGIEDVMCALSTILQTESDPGNETSKPCDPCDLLRGGTASVTKQRQLCAAMALLDEKQRELEKLEGRATEIHR